MICFEIIVNVGNARSLYIEAIREAKVGHFEKAQELIDEGMTFFTIGHHAHAKLVAEEADTGNVQVSLILVHAEDQLMSAEGFKILAEEFIDVYKKINQGCEKGGEK